MWIASSTSPPGGAGPSATSSGSIPRALANAGTSNSTRRIRRRRSMFGCCARSRADGSIQVRPQPALGLLDRDTAAPGIIFELVAADPRDAEILAIAVAEIEARHRRGRQHREILGQRHLTRISAQHLEQHGFEAVVGAGGIAGRRAGPGELFADQVGGREMLVGITPQAVWDGRRKEPREDLRAGGGGG